MSVTRILSLVWIMFSILLSRLTLAMWIESQNVWPFFLLTVLLTSLIFGAMTGVTAALLSLLTELFFSTIKTVWIDPTNSDDFEIYGFSIGSAIVIIGAQCSKVLRRMSIVKSRGSESIHHMLLPKINGFKANDLPRSAGESTILFHDIAKFLPVLTWVSNADGSVEFCNGHATPLYKFSSFTYSERTWKMVVHADDYEKLAAAWEVAILHKQDFICEHRMSMSDGAVRWHLSRATPHIKSGRSTIDWYGISTDIHNIKLVEEQLKKEKKLADEANDAKSRFLAIMSHEIRTPLTSILGYSDLLHRKKLSEERRLSYVSRIKTSGDHLLTIINDLLDIAKVEAGEIKIDRQVFHVLDVITEAVKSMQVLADSKGLEIGVVFETPIPCLIETDPGRFQQIMLNLISNAVKFTDKGRIRIILKYHDQCRRLPNSGSQLEVEIEDTGAGIDRERQHELFQPFSQVKDLSSKITGGTGLGLYLSRKLAQALGGDIFLNWSLPGKGSSFVFQIQVDCINEDLYVSSLEEESGFVVRDRATSITLSKKLRILLAEDAIDNQFLMRMYLSKIAEVVDIAKNGEEAVALALSNEYDVVLMDIGLPIVDGLEATYRLRKAGFERPIIAITAHAFEEEVNKAISMGCNMHLSKPVRQEALLGAILKILKKVPDDKAQNPQILH